MASEALREHRRKSRREKKRKGVRSVWDVVIPLLTLLALTLPVAGIGISWYEMGAGGGIVGGLGMAGILLGICSFVISRMEADRSESYIHPAQVFGIIGICAAAAAAVVLAGGIIG